MNGFKPSPEQFLALDEELRDSVRLIQFGLGALQGTGGDNDFYHLPTLLLASGMERLMKVVLWLDNPRPGAFPKAHRLAPLVEKVLERCFTASYSKKVPAATTDREHLESPQTRKMLDLLGEFGDAARYYNLNVLLGRPHKTRDAQAVWHELRLEVARSTPELWDKVGTKEWSDEFYADLVRPYVVVVERTVRALARLLTLGPLAETGKRWSPILQHFCGLKDQDLGTTAY